MQGVNAQKEKLSLRVKEKYLNIVDNIKLKC